MDSIEKVEFDLGHVVVGNNYHSQHRYHSTSFEGLASSPDLFSVKIP